MRYTNFKTDITDGIALFTWDMPERSMNVITLEVMDEIDMMVDHVVGDDAITGAIIASGKAGSFTGGADITMLHAMRAGLDEAAACDPEAADQLLFAQSSRLSRVYRKMETCGKPFVVAINGTCLGGGTELALAAHGRVMVDDGKAKMGLPEVKIGIFPGAGGTQRVMRMADPQAGLQILLQGRNLDAKKAKAMNLVDIVVTDTDQLIEAARHMLVNGLSPEKPWDQKGFKLPAAAKIYSPAGFNLWPAASAIYRKETHDNYPGARAIMTSVYEGLLLPMDQALEVESRYFAKVLKTPEAANMIRSLFISMQALNKGARRPKGIAERRLKTVAVVGAGFMGAGIAYVTARAGMEVVLLDQSQAAADKGKSYSAGLMDKAMKRGKASEADKQTLLDRITATADFANIAQADLVIEAVFEDRQVKADVMSKINGHLREGVVLASNTSTLPITSLAANHRDAEQFIGIHFFSPVDKMMLVEIIRGDKTGDAALAVALDYVGAIKKTPIVVNDTRGFYANRAVMAYLREAHLMLTEGVPAAMVENVARQAGMPVGPLALTDEVAVDLAWKILQATKADLGPQAIDPAQEKLLHAMVVGRERLGRKNGKGFYDYQGRNKHLWAGLAEIVPQEKDPDKIDAIDQQQLKDRLLVIQALEAARCVEEGVITDMREADVGSILGFGFAPYTGGTLSYIDTMGTDQFVALCEDLAAQYGARFTPPDLLRDLARAGEGFYQRFGGSDGSLFGGPEGQS